MEFLRTEMPDGSQWDVPISVIAQHHAAFFAPDFNDDTDKSLQKGTWPLFHDDPFEIIAWASDNMEWSDVVEHAVMIKPSQIDYEDGWYTGNKEVVLQGGEVLD